jgi:hypothetical protein
MREIAAWVILGILLFLYISQKVENSTLSKENTRLTDKINNEYEKNQAELQDSISSLQRSNLVLSDSLVRIVLSTKRVILTKDSLKRELSKIKGRYSNKTSKELGEDLTTRSGANDPITVGISDSTATYALESIDSLQIYKQRDSTHEVINTKNLTTIAIQAIMLENHGKEIKLMAEQHQETQEQLKSETDRADSAEKQLKRQKVKGVVKDVLVGAAAIGLLILIL